MSDVRKALEAAVNGMLYARAGFGGYTDEARAAVLAFLKAMPESKILVQHRSEIPIPWTPLRLAAAVEKETP